MTCRRMLSLPLAAAVLATGCQQPRFQTQADYVHYNRISGERRDQPADGTVEAVAVAAPPTVEDFGKLAEYPLSLEEAKRLALGNNKQILYLGQTPGQRGTRIDSSLAAFDAIYGFGGQWGQSSRQISNAAQAGANGATAQTTQSFGSPAGGNGQNLTSGGPVDGGTPLPALNVLNLQKRNATGGVTSLNYSVDYTRQNPAGFTLVNPSWNNTVTLSMAQPLLQGAGVEYNRAPILIARAGFEQSIKDFDAKVRELLRDTELADWQLHGAYRVLKAREHALDILLQTWRNQAERLRAGTKAPRDVARTREDYDRGLAQMLSAQQDILTAELQLRRQCGLPPSDGKRLVLKDTPSQARYAANWSAAVLETMELRPELASQRLAVRAAEINLLRQKNGLLPDLTVGGSYNIYGLDDQYDKSLNRLFSDRFTGWNLYFRLSAPIGERAAHADVRQAKLVLASEHHKLRVLEDQYLSELQQDYQELRTNFARIQPLKNVRQALKTQVESDQAQYDVGKINIDEMVADITRLSQAEADEATAIVLYNQSLARWEFARGTILRNDNVCLAEEICCNVDEGIRERVRRQLACAWTIPIHAGNQPHERCPEGPDRSLPVYQTALPDLAAPAFPVETPKADEPKKDDRSTKSDDAKKSAARPLRREPLPLLPVPSPPASVDVPPRLPPAVAPAAPPQGQVQSVPNLPAEPATAGWNAVPTVR